MKKKREGGVRAFKDLKRQILAKFTDEKDETSVAKKKFAVKVLNAFLAERDKGKIASLDKLADSAETDYYGKEAFYIRFTQKTPVEIAFCLEFFPAYIDCTFGDGDEDEPTFYLDDADYLGREYVRLIESIQADHQKAMAKAAAKAKKQAKTL